MFYSQFILAKKGPLGTIWIAAHLERKLRKNQVAETDIGVTVDSILFPDVPIALRLSGHLLLGVVRVYSRQVNYLFNDCSETLVKIKQAFHSTAVDLPPEATTAPFHSITLPETFDFDELELLQDSETAFLRGPNGNYVDHHVTPQEQITLQDSIEDNPYLGSSQFGLDERFGDGNFSAMAMDFDEEFSAKKAQDARTPTPLLMEETFPPLNDGKDEETQMDVDDPYATTESLYQNKKIVIDHEEAPILSIDQNEEDNNRGLSMVSPFPEPLGDQIITSIASPSMLEPRKDGNASSLSPPLGIDDTLAVVEAVPSSVSYKNERLNVHAYIPYVEAYTPDLNVEFRPPDEPSTPALLDEASLSMYNESSVETQKKSPLGLHESSVSSNTDLEAGSNRNSLNIQSDHQKQTSSVQSQCSPPFTGLASSPTLNLQEENVGVLSTMDGDNSAILSHEIETTEHQVPSTEVTEDPKLISDGFTFSPVNAPGVPNDAFVGTFINPTDEINQDSSIAGMIKSAPSFQLISCPSLNAVSLNNELECSNTNEEVNPSLAAHGTTISSSQPELAAQNIIQDVPVSDQQCMEQGDVTVEASTVLLPSVQVDTSSVSIMPVSEAASLEQTMIASVETQIASQAQFVDASVEQLDVLPETQTISMEEIPECETLRSAVELPSETSGLVLLEKNLQDERIPTLESERTTSGIIESYSTAVEPVFDETPVLTEWNPQTASKISPLSTGSFNFLPEDNDVLASILGRRKSSAFKVAPTPKENAIVKKRKVAPRSVTKKRKCDFDTPAVLPGDVIRQQLAYTEDIRRERTKAPCTRREVWSFNKEVEGQQHFDEPLFLGLHSDLHDLFHDILNSQELRNSSPDKVLKEGTPAMKSADSLTDIGSMSRFSLNNEDKQPDKDDSVILQSMISDRPESSVLEDCSEHLRVDTEITCSSNEELLAAEISKHQDSNTQDNRQEVAETCTEHLTSIMHDDPHAQNLEDVNISGVPDSEVFHPEVLEKPEESEQAIEAAHTNVVEGHCMTEQVEEVTDTEVLEAPQAIEEAVEITHTEVLEGPETRKLDVDVTHIEGLEGQIAVEQAVGVTVPQPSEQPVEVKDLLSAVPESNEQALKNSMLNEENSSEKNHFTAMEMESNGVNIDEIGGTGSTLAEDTTVTANDSLEHVSMQLCTQDSNQGEANGLHSDEKNAQDLVPDLEKDATDLSTVRDQEPVDASATQLEDMDQAALDAPDGEISAIPTKDGHTDFLADDDETVYPEVYEDSGDERDPSILENSGWSVRSRKVGRYLKTMFEGMEDVSCKTGQEVRNLGLDRLLAYKTRREAARMFFETLVLKTKGYIQVKQELAYEDIHLYPSPKLMKTTF